VQIDYDVVHLRTSLVQLFVLLQLNFEEVVQIIELRRFGGAPNGYPFAALAAVKQRYFKQHGGLLLFEEMKSKQGLSFTLFTKEELEEAKFDDRNVLGKAGNNTVYKGTLKDKRLVAMKRCKLINERQEKEFGKEMLILSQVNHRNVVRLYC
jgi:hypothetical protein